MIDFLDDIDVGAVRIITFDMSRAFDRIPHDMLLSCLCSLNIPNRDLFTDWINSYLSNRQQRVRIGNFKSSLCYVSSGVPQGSILGPLLFAIYFSSYKPCHSKSRVVKYADDITLIIPVCKTSFDDMSLVNEEISFFENWCDNHKMCINLTKTKVLNVNFSSKFLTPIPLFDNVTVVKLLGVYFNSKLTWRDHFDFVSKKVSSRLYVLRTLKPFLDHNELVTVFYALIQSLFDYASPLFMNAPDYLDSKVISLCKRAFRIIHGSSVESCHLCDMLAPIKRREVLAMRLFKDALLSPLHMLHGLLPPFSQRSRRLILPRARTQRKTDAFIFTEKREEKPMLRMG